MANSITLNINATDKASYRKQLIPEFLNEQPSTANNVIEYFYYVDNLQGGNRIYLKRPTSLNKGVDFEVRVEHVQFKYGVYGNVISTGNRPSHDDSYRNLLDRTYNCCPFLDSEYSVFSFTSGHSVEIIFTALRWFFIEQDIMYWNRSGRAMLYNGLVSIW